MGQVGTDRKIIDIPMPIRAPVFSPPVKVPEPQREPVPVRREES